MRIRYALIGLLGLLHSAVAAGSMIENFSEGTHYQKLSQAVAENELVKGVRQDDKVIVLDFFSYGCAWCFKIDPVLEKWVKKAGDKVQLTRIPVDFQPGWTNLAKAYYTAETLNALPKVHDALFDAVFNERVTDSTRDTLRKFFISRGIEAETFLDTFDSDIVKTKHQQGKALFKAYRLVAIPAIIVQGPEGAYLTSIKMAGDEKNLVNVIDRLVKMQQTTPEVLLN